MLDVLRKLRCIRLRKFLRALSADKSIVIHYYTSFQKYKNKLEHSSTTYNTKTTFVKKSSRVICMKLDSKDNTIYIYATL